MAFIEKYLRSVNSSDLRDDEHHHSTLALTAAARADQTGAGTVLGSLLARVKYASGSRGNPARAGHMEADIERAKAEAAAQLDERIKAIRKWYAEAETGLDTNLAELLRIWIRAVTEKGRARKWLKPRTPWDVEAAYALYERVAKASLALWLDDLCSECSGRGVTLERRICPSCRGSGKAELPSGRYEAELTRDMVSELESIYQAHSGRASSLLRRAA